MLTQKQLNEVIKLQKALQRHNCSLRDGQAFYIALVNCYGNEADRIYKTEYDPFYDDTKLSKCKQFLLGENNA